MSQPSGNSRVRPTCESSPRAHSHSTHRHETESSRNSNSRSSSHSDSSSREVSAATAEENRGRANGRGAGEAVSDTVNRTGSETRTQEAEGKRGGMTSAKATDSNNASVSLPSSSSSSSSFQRHAGEEEDDSSHCRGTAAAMDDEAEAGGTGGRIQRIRLCDTLETLMQRQDYLLRRRLSEPCLSCMQKLCALTRCTALRTALEHRCFPSPVELIALERAFGQTLELEDVFGDTSLVANTAPVSGGEEDGG